MFSGLKPLLWMLASEWVELRCALKLYRNRPVVGLLLVVSRVDWVGSRFPENQGGWSRPLQLYPLCSIPLWWTWKKVWAEKFLIQWLLKPENYKILTAIASHWCHEHCVVWSLLRQLQDRRMLQIALQQWRRLQCAYLCYISRRSTQVITWLTYFMSLIPTAQEE